MQKSVAIKLVVFLLLVLLSLLCLVSAIFWRTSCAKKLSDSLRDCHKSDTNNDTKATFHNESSSELEGLQASIKSLDWNEGKLHVVYSLCFRDRGRWALRCFTVLKIKCWDADLSEIDSDIFVQVIFDEDFQFGSNHFAEYEIKTIVPPRARYLAVQFGDTKLITKPIPIPSLSVF